MTNVRHPRGNALALIAATTIVVLLVVGFLVFKVGNLTGSQREAQTAIDAAALQAAKELANITYQSPLLGNIAATDLPPSQQTPTGAIGINTALATARLDALIATNVGNTTMQFLAKRDIDELQNNVKPQLISRIRAQLTSGAAIQRIRDAYNNNARRGTRNDAQLDAKDNIQISLGALTSDSTTNLRVPNGNDPGLNGSHQSNGFYKAYVAIPLPGVGGTVTFSSIGDQPRIVDNAQYRPLVDGSSDLPTVVRVETDSTVLDRGQDVQGQKGAPRTIHNIATAVAGSDYIAPISTTYCVSFKGGFPASSAVGASFDSVASIMNTAVLGVDGSSQGNGPWGPLPGRTWFRAPGNGSIPPGPSLPTGFPGSSTTGNIDSTVGSVSLSFGMYDWIRSLGLRVNQAAMTSALTDNLRARVPSAPPVGQPVIFTGMNVIGPPAYAADDNTIQQNSCWLAIPSQPVNDPRYQGVVNMNGSDSAGAQMVTSTFGYAFASAVCPPTAAATSITEDGAQTTSGQNIRDLGDFQNANIKTNHAGECARDAGEAVRASKQAEADQLRADSARHTQQATQADTDAQNAHSQANALRTEANASNPPDQNKLNQAASLDQQGDAKTAQAAQLRGQAADENTRAAAAQVIADRADAVKAMGSMAVSQTFATQSNMQALTGQGLSETNSQNFTLAGSAYAASMTCKGDSNFLNHPTAAQIDAMKAAILASTSDDDPQLSNGNGQQWCKRTWKVYTHATQPVITHNNNPVGMPVALAQSASPPNNNLMFLFNIQGNWQAQGNGTVTITPLPLSPFINNAVSHGQCFYYAPGSLNVTVNSVPIAFSVVARDEVAVGEAYDSGANQAAASPRYCHGGTFNMDLPDNGGNDCPTLGGEWQLTCPIPGGCVQSQTVTSNGSLVVTPCPPPPPQMG